MTISHKYKYFSSFEAGNSFYLNFHSLEVVSLYHDPQPQKGKNYSICLILKQNICKSWCLSTHFVPNISDLIDK